MKLTPPKVITFWISVVLGVLGLIGQVGIVAALTPYAFWFAFVGLVVLVLGLLVERSLAFHSMWIVSTERARS